ncbi:MAG: hypothetical protein AM1032_000325 [Mycoplasmataceae bacterium]|nr:MAG: hypothetical protein AM1032_000325 [Mycoplasmataceae bacterium]
MKTNISISLEENIYREVKKISEENKNEFSSISSIVNKLLSDFNAEWKKKQLIEAYKKSAMKKTAEWEIWEGTIEDGIK